MIAAETGHVAQPQEYMIAKVDDKLVLLLEGSVAYFRPEEILSEEEAKDGTIHLQKSHLKPLQGYPDDHKVIGLIAH